jgi:hypothetical protein
VYATAVADAGGLLTASGIVEGLRHDVIDYVALDATTLLLAEYLVVLHEGRPTRAAADFADIGRIVTEWFPVRAVALDAALNAANGEVDSYAALALAETLGIPLVTRNDDLRSRKVPVLRS